MNESIVLVAIVVAIMMSFAIIAVVMVAWRMVKVVESVSGANTRALNNERALYLKQIEKFVEKRDLGTQSHLAMDLANRHREERMLETQVAADVEKAAVQSNSASAFKKPSVRNKPMTDKQILGLHR